MQLPSYKRMGLPECGLQRVQCTARQVQRGNMLSCLFWLLLLRRMQAENDALQSLVLEVAANKAEAKAKVARLKEKYDHLLRKACACYIHCLLCCLLKTLPIQLLKAKLQSSSCARLWLGLSSGAVMLCCKEKSKTGRG